MECLRILWWESRSLGAHSILVLYGVTLDGIFDIILGSDWNGLDGYEGFFAGTGYLYVWIWISHRLGGFEVWLRG